MGGACQLSSAVIARSVSPIEVAAHTITRMAVTDAKDSSTNDTGARQTMGHKYTVPYGLYLTHGYVSANLAQQTGFTESDLKLFWGGTEEHVRD